MSGAADALLGVIRALLAELRGGDKVPVALDDALERDLGIDSLARMELMLRLERSFGLQLDERAVQAAETVRDLLQALRAGRPRGAGVATGGAPAGRAAGEEGVELPHGAQTLVQVLQWHAQRLPGRCHVRLLQPQGGWIDLTHEALLQQAHAVAGALQRQGVAAGDTVALMLPTSLAFLECFMGILLAGAVPVPIYPPLRASQVEDHLRRQAAILDNAAAVLLISDASALPAARLLRAGASRMRAVLTADELLASAAPCAAVARGPQDIALVQYTSGSTGQPKGVVLTHANLLANIRAMGEGLKATAEDVFVSWLPLYHDMGLIGAWLGSLYHGLLLVLMAPQDFLGRPSRWLRAISDHRATLTGAPNFAYEILATRVPDDELQGLDLRSLRAALNGSEPVHAATLGLFCERFAGHGFDRRALMPVYGLAECGVGLAFPPPGRGPRIDMIDRRTLRDDGLARPVALAAADAIDAAAVVCCGAALPGHELRVVDDHGVELPDRHEGRIQFRGPSATAGYLRNAEATRGLFRGDWLDTGDVGYVAGGEVFVTSRVKDLIKRGGRNLHPYDLEAAVGALAGVRRGCVAVFGVPDAASRNERIVVVAETRLTPPAALKALRSRIAALSVEVLGTAADDIVLAPPRAVLKTSSGKIRRAACRELYEQGRLGRRGRRVAWQLVRLWAQAASRRLRAPRRRWAAWGAAAWMWGVFCLAAVLGIGAALVLPRRWRKRAARAVSRAALAAGGLPIRVRRNAAPAAGPCVVVSNHASYLDWLVLTSVLPAEVGFVAKRELSHPAPLGWLLARMGVRFVEREDVRASVEDAAALAAIVRQGHSLAFFPEGTLTRAPGLRPFHLGAFVAAAQAGVPVVPVALSGTRSVLRDGDWMPRRGAVGVHIGPALQPAQAGWQEAVRLRDAARQCIAQACGEPLLSR